MISKNRKLRFGYTTGACAAAAVKAATMLLMKNVDSTYFLQDVEIPFPDGSRVKFKVHNTYVANNVAAASVIKDAGDDPDVTNGAEIMAEVRRQEADGKNGRCPHFSHFSHFCIKGGKGVGIVTKPGLPVPIGESAINPVPRQMIKEAVREVTGDPLDITISVPNGEKLAKKTLNARLGIIGGISILGTTGIVTPVSAQAWTSTITLSMDVARAMGCDEVVLSTGRTSEKAHMKRYGLPEECYIMMGDFVEFSLLEAKRHGFKKIYLNAQWAKMLKIAMATPQTHVKYGAIDINNVVKFLKNMDKGIDGEFNTAREIFDAITAYPTFRFAMVCDAAKRYAQGIIGDIPVTVCLISYNGEVIVEHG